MANVMALVLCVLVIFTRSDSLMTPHLHRSVTSRSNNTKLTSQKHIYEVQIKSRKKSSQMIAKIVSESKKIVNLPSGQVHAGAYAHIYKLHTYIHTYVHTYIHTHMYTYLSMQVEPSCTNQVRSIKIFTSPSQNLSYSKITIIYLLILHV